MMFYGDDRNIFLPEIGEWDYLIANIDQDFPDSIFSLEITLKNGNAILNGNLENEDAHLYLIEMLRNHPLVEGIQDHIEITAAFSSADALDDAFDQPLPTDEAPSEPIIRFPSITPLREAIPGDFIKIDVDLKLEIDTQTDGQFTPITDAPVNWKTIDIEVQLISAYLDFGSYSDNQIITIRKDAASIPATFTATILHKTEGLSEFEVIAIFFYKGRQSGSARRLVPIARAEQANPTSIAKPIVNDPPKAAHHSAGSVSINLNVPPPSLTIQIFKIHGLSVGSYFWTWSSPDDLTLFKNKARNSALVHLGEEAKDFNKRLFSDCKNLEPGIHEDTLFGLGNTIWNKTPDNFKAHYLALREKMGNSFPIQILTDEHFVPWEMMCPVLEDSNEIDHLFMTHPIARWFQDVPYVRSTSFKAGGILSFAPKYNGRERLQNAEKECDWFVDTLRAVRGTATYDGFTRTLSTDMPERSVQIVHFAGHGDGNPETKQGLKMEDGRWVSANSVNHPRTKLGERDRSLFILNACEVGATTLTLGVADGWPLALAERGFGGILAPLWAIDDNNASTIVKDLIPAFLAGHDAFAGALTTARRACRKSSSTPYAYLFYGEVMAYAQK